ncbi:MAG: MFS transporter [Rickettsiales bacterium]|nr:MFS transporter [Rickettsiales bacterium]
MKTVSDATALSLLKWGEFFIYFLMIVPIAVLLYQDKGVSVGDFFLIQGIFRVASFALEIPSGYLSDTFSRRKILILGALIWLAGNIGLFFAYGFWEIAICEILFGFSMALFSGTKEAYAYDLLKRSSREKQFLKEYGTITTFAQSAGFIAAIIGGTLYALIGNWVIAIEAFMAFLAVLCVVFLPELREVKRSITPESSPLRDLIGIVKMSVKHPEIKWFMLWPAIYASFTLVLMWILQPTMETVGVATALFGIFVAINQGSRIVFAKYAHKIYGILGPRKLLFSLIGILVLAIAAVFGTLHAGNMAVVYVLCVIIAIVPASQKLAGLVFNTYIHHRVKSSERGTVLSVSAMYNTLLTGGIMILMKPLLDGFGIEFAMAATLALLAVIIIPTKKIMAMKL